MKTAYKFAEVLYLIVAVAADVLSVIPFYFSNWDVMNATLGLGITFAATSGFLARNRDTGGLLIAALALFGGVGAGLPSLHAEGLENAICRWVAIACVIGIVIVGQLWDRRPWPRKKKAKSGPKTDRAQKVSAPAS